MSSIFGGSKSSSTSESYNLNNSLLTGSLSPYLDYVGSGGNALQSLLGGDATGFNNFKDAVGYDWELGQGLGSIAAKNLASGLGDSGATLKALANYQTGLNNQYLDKYLTGTSGLADIGLGTANALVGAGQYNKNTSTSKSSGGLGGLIGAGLSGWASGGFK